MKYLRFAIHLVIASLSLGSHAAFKVDYESGGVAGEQLSGSAKVPVLSGKAAIESKKKLLLDNSVVWLERKGECGGAVTSGTADGVSFAVGAGMIVPRGWQVFSVLDDDLSDIKLSWVGGEPWLNPIARMAEKYRVRMEADCSKKTLTFLSRPTLGEYADTNNRFADVSSMSVSIPEAPVVDSNDAVSYAAGSEDAQEIGVVSGTLVGAGQGAALGNTIIPRSRESLFSYASRYADQKGLAEPVYRVADINKAMSVPIDIYPKKKLFSAKRPEFSLDHALSVLNLYFATGTNAVTKEVHLVVTDNPSIIYENLSIFTIRNAPISQSAIHIANTYGYSFGERNEWGHDVEWTNPYPYHLISTDVLDGLTQLLDNYPIAANIVPSTKTVFVSSRISRR